MGSESRARQVLLGMVTVLLLAASVASMWVFIADWQARDIVTRGVTVAGRDLSGMKPEQVRTVVDEAVSTPMMRPVTVAGDDTTWTLRPQGLVEVDLDAMVDAAYRPRRESTLFQRMAGDLMGEKLPADVKPEYSVDTSAVTEWVNGAAAQIDRKPVDAKRTIVKYAFKISPAVYGRAVDRAAAVERVAQVLAADAALATESRVTSLPVTKITPKIVESSFKKAIIVSLSQTRIYLYNGAKLEKTYLCAPGQPAWPTPKGDFKIVTKLANAPWINPGSPWAASMPKVIPGGPGNPMGDRKIGINYPGVFFHGIPPSEYSSIGTHASHGCMRMMPSAVHDLYGRVTIGVPVYIRS